MALLNPYYSQTNCWDSNIYIYIEQRNIIINQPISVAINYPILYSPKPYLLIPFLLNLSGVNIRWATETNRLHVVKIFNQSRGLSARKPNTSNSNSFGSNSIALVPRSL